MLKLKGLQNVSTWNGEKPTIVITTGDPEWNEAYSNWINGKNPTNSVEWKKGIVMTFQLY